MLSLSHRHKFQIFQQDPFPKVICTDCYSNLVIFSEFKKICRNADGLLRKYQIKADSPEMETTHNTKGNGKCKSIRNSDDMAQRIRETAYKKSLTFVENMKSFYFLLNQIEDLESGNGQAIIKNEISTESLIPTVEINIKNEVIYPTDENQMMTMGSVIQQNPESSGESKRKKRKNNKRKSVNGQQTMEIDETGNIVARQISINPEQHQQQSHQNIQISTQNDNEMALMLTVKSVDDDNHQQTIQQPAQIQIHSNHTLPSISHHPSSTSSTVTTSPQTITFLFPFSATTSTAGAPNEHHYQQVTLPQSSVSQIVTTTIQPPANQQFPPFSHKKYFDSEFLKHMIQHNVSPGPSSQPVATIQKVTTVIERDRNSSDISAIPTDLSSSTSTQYK